VTGVPRRVRNDKFNAIAHPDHQDQHRRRVKGVETVVAGANARG